MLATTPHMFGVLGPSSDEADVTAPLLNAAKVPMFADTGQASFDHTKLQYFWRMVPADDVQGYAMAAATWCSMVREVSTARRRWAAIRTAPAHLAAASFFRHLARVPGWQVIPVTQAAQQVQRSAVPNGYAQFEPEARAIASSILAACPTA